LMVIPPSHGYSSYHVPSSSSSYYGGWIDE
jgi:hypothetical protein